MELSQIKRDHYYSNAQYGNNWSVRQIIEDSHEDKMTYKIVAGKGRRKMGTCTQAEFADWAVHEVYRNENSWQKVV